MPITFHCEHCGKKISAKDGAEGKWGKCPACHNEIYVPGETGGEDIKIAPVDESEEVRRKRLMAETYRLTQDILQERDVPDGTVEAAGWTSKISDKDLTKSIILYLRQMADGNLDEAQVTAEAIVPTGSRAVKILDQIGVSEMPEPELADVPPQVLSGLIRNLRTRIS